MGDSQQTPIQAATSIPVADEAEESRETGIAAGAKPTAASEPDVAAHTAQLRELTVALALIEERERRAIAMDLHDDLGQTLALLKMRLDVLHKRAPPGVFADELEDASQMVLLASNRVRSLAFQLSPTILYELGLVPALEWLADEMKRQYSLSVEVSADAAARGPLDLTIRTVLFRAVRELLINVAKHANTNAAHVACRRPDGKMVLVVADSGRGFDARALLAPGANRGYGLLSVRERLAGLGGTMDFESMPGDGSRVILRVPIAPASIGEAP